MLVKQVGKPAIQAIADKQNKVSTLKEAIINAAEDRSLIIKEIQRIEKEKQAKKLEKVSEQKIDIQDLKENAEKLVLDIEGR